MIKLSQFVEYMVDVKGMTEDEASRLFVDVGGCVEEILGVTGTQELIEFCS